MGVGISFYYGVGKRLKDILTPEEYSDWAEEEMDENHVLSRLEKVGYGVSSSEEWGWILEVGVCISDGDGYKNYCNNSFHKENWIARLLASDLSEMKKEIAETIEEINKVAGRKLIDSEPYFYSRG